DYHCQSADSGGNHWIF
nr:immunoglobulin light chain junction region [Macaca mulatta]MOW27348.1 immunoglobulin light chain junction region [Macaca mulatta]MOW27452.1 immunoglobulin light chain junction region [Macaca mulatta]MOW27651.1 immunoglobulin light chain junction region [Macaca mulatta]MOW27708.1 immunoglobulin light chain junction region [Macaca mulatta]